MKRKMCIMGNEKVWEPGAVSDRVRSNEGSCSNTAYVNGAAKAKKASTEITFGGSNGSGNGRRM
jgi:hypothetical protein